MNNEEFDSLIQEGCEGNIHQDSERYRYDCDNDCDNDCGCNNDCDCNDDCGCESDCNCGCGCNNDCGCNDGCRNDCDEGDNCNMDAANSDASWYEDTRRPHRPVRPCENEADRRRCRALLKRIQCLSFALWDTILFLDMHPCDECAKRYYCRIKRLLDECICVYERNCGPLSAHSVNCNDYGWRWVHGAWPWEGRD